MNDWDKHRLKEAANIIARELRERGEVKVPGFGKFYLSRVKWSDNDSGTFGTVNTVRFKPFGKLKEAVGKRTVDGTLGDGKRPGNFASMEIDFPPADLEAPGCGAPAEPPRKPEPGKPAPVISILRKS